MNKGKNNILIKQEKLNVEVLIVYRKRKNITIQVRPKDKVSIISPPNVSEKALKEIILENKNWIINKIEKYKDIDEAIDLKKIENGSILYYLGNEYILEIIINNMKEDIKSGVLIRDNKLIIYTKSDEEEYIRSKIKIWYKSQSEKIVKERLLILKTNSAVMYNLEPSKLKVKEQKKRWGSCTSEKSIYINSKLSMLRISAIDYILVHEFCHLVHMNHSKSFYNLVKSIMPTYKTEVEWLKKNNHKFIL
ncbi:MAG: M48 family metallopeptidase [Peptostreptococcaceae bacterium]